MTALCIGKNNTHLVSMQFLPSASFGVYLSWAGDAVCGVLIYVVRTEECGGQGKWSDMHLVTGEKISFFTMKTDKFDPPALVQTEEGFINQVKSKVIPKPQAKVKSKTREVGFLDCFINDSQLFSFQLSTSNTLLVGLSWDSDQSRKVVIDVDSVVLPRSKLPIIGFQDKVTFH